MKNRLKKKKKPFSAKSMKDWIDTFADFDLSDLGDDAKIKDHLNKNYKAPAEDYFKKLLNTKFDPIIDQEGLHQALQDAWDSMKPQLDPYWFPKMHRQEFRVKRKNGKIETHILFTDTLNLAKFGTIVKLKKGDKVI
jgi:hypothetical protein